MLPSILAALVLVFASAHTGFAFGNHKKLQLKNLLGSLKGGSRVTINILSQNNQVLGSQATSTAGDGQVDVDLGTNDPSTVNLRIKPHGFLSKIVPSTDLNNISSSVPVSQFAAGDVNDDNVINAQDFTDMKQQWGQSNAPADLNGDGVVNSLDFMLMKSNFGQSGQ